MPQVCISRHLPPSPAFSRLLPPSPAFFGFDGMPQDATKALEVVAETHAAWRSLTDGGVPADGLALE